VTPRRGDKALLLIDKALLLIALNPLRFLGGMRMSSFKRFLLRPRKLNGLVLLNFVMFVGMIIYGLLSIFSPNWVEATSGKIEAFFSNKAVQGAILVLFGFGGAIVFGTLVMAEKFVDIDRTNRTSRKPRVPTRSKSTAEKNDITDVPRPAQTTPPDFSTYFFTLVAVLQEKSSDADEKASLLLDKGVSYSVAGIAFYIFSIVAWQVLTWQRGSMQPQFLYGIVSCSILFMFIEFLSAWFLKQYRAYVDTATYLVKVKSLFDRYMLTYLAQADAKIAAAPESPASAALFTMLSADLKWPESYLTRDPDSNIAREFMASVTELAGVIRDSKGNRGTESSK
jgi:hypothetical protein